MTALIDDTRIRALKELVSPQKLVSDIPIDAQLAEHVAESRAAIHQCLHGHDDRLIVVVGPCSIHDPRAAMDYAQRLMPVARRHAKDLLVIMRVYFEKPRTTVGWKGLINDPDLDDSFNINKGLHLARQLLVDINRWAYRLALNTWI